MGYEIAVARQYDPYYTYWGEAAEVSFEAIGPGERWVDISNAVEAWAATQDLTMIQLIVEVDPEPVAWVAYRYRVYVLTHGSPFLWAIVVPLIWALSIIITGFFAWRMVEVYFGAQRQYYDTVKNEQQILATMTPEERASYVDARQKTSVAAPSTPGLELGDIIKWGVIGGVAILGISAASQLLSSRRG